MKTVLAFLVVLGVLCCCALADKPAKCHDGDDCDDDECCIMNETNPFRRGRCGKLSKHGESCSDPGTNYPEKFRKRCPCAEGLVCEAEYEEDTGHYVFRVNETCVANNA